MSSAILYLLYPACVLGSAVWVYRDAQRQGFARPRLVALGVSVFFPIGILVYVLSR